MTAIEEVQKRLALLSREERAVISTYLQKLDEADWDARIVEDAVAGRLNPLLREVEVEEDWGNLVSLNEVLDNR